MELSVFLRKVASLRNVDLKPDTRAHRRIRNADTEARFEVQKVY